MNETKLKMIELLLIESKMILNWNQIQIKDDWVKIEFQIIKIKSIELTMINLKWIEWSNDSF